MPRPQTLHRSHDTRKSNLKNPKIRIFSHWGPYMKKWWLYFSLVINLSALLWGLTALKFSFTWVWRKDPPPPPNMKKYYFFHILGLNLKMYIDMGERIAGKQDMFRSLKTPLRAPKIYIFLAPPAEMQRSFSNTDLSVVRPSVCPSVKIEGGGGGGGEGSISETLQ